jgi:hypothetical protein
MRCLIPLLTLLLFVGPVFAEGAATVVTQPCKISGTTLTSTAKAAASAATTLDGIQIKRTRFHSVYAEVTATQAVSLLVTAYGSIDGTTRTTFSPTVTATLAMSGTVKRLIVPLSLPVTPYVIFTIGPDATYPITYTAFDLLSQ